MRGHMKPLETDESLYRDVFSSVELATKARDGYSKICNGTLLVQLENLHALDQFRATIDLNGQTVDALRVDGLLAMGATG